MRPREARPLRLGHPATLSSFQACLGLTPAAPENLTSTLSSAPFQGLGGPERQSPCPRSHSRKKSGLGLWGLKVGELEGLKDRTMSFLAVLLLEPVLFPGSVGEGAGEGATFGPLPPPSPGG